MAERSETAVGTTTGGPRADVGRTEQASEATSPLSAEALATELVAEPEAPADADATAAAPAPADAPEAAPKDEPGHEPEDGPKDGPEQPSGAEAEPAHRDDAQPTDARPEGARPKDARADDAQADAQPADARKDTRADKRATDAQPAEETTEETTEAGVETTVAETAGENAPEEASVPAPVRHSGDRIARRYRLEECTTSNEVFSSWRAVDEKLRRAVGIHLIAAAHPRAKGVLAAARQAALLGDPRFVQVLDAVEDGDVVYVVREWLPDATGLDTMLLTEPLEAYEAYQLVRQLADALTAAHRRGLAHLRLSPACVLRTDSGSYRIDGMAVNAALRGIQAEDKADGAQRDTRAIGALLFAALTLRWPYSEGAHGLQGLPRDLGTVPAERVKAGVHRGLSDLTARTLCSPPGGKLTPVTTPEELAKAVAEMPKVRQPEPEPLVLPTYPTTVRNTARRPDPSAPGARTTPPPRRPQTPPAPQPTLPGRSGKALKWAVSLVVLGAIALGSWGTAEALMTHDNSGSTNTQLSQGGQGQGQGHGSSGGQQSGQDNAGRQLKNLPISSDAEFAPFNQPMKPEDAPLAIDGKVGTSWITKYFIGEPKFGNLPDYKDGSGIVVDLGSVQNVSEVKVTLPTGGQTQEILAAPADASGEPTSLSGFTQRISNSALLQGTALDSGVLAKPVRTRYVLIHIISLPSDPSSGGYRGGISEIQVLG
ncbi:protein kinase family protein [Streptacidiphilus melanogenes]|uniref:protein kinase family protein n=1 Tax=Streptacidiphilus melanogenes TaxID=411235 RepID=UPI0006938F34|nr:protein kinase family protein [Streptacidiphilus melanogenes]